MKTRLFAILMLILFISNVYSVGASSCGLKYINIEIDSCKEILPWIHSFKSNPYFNITLTNVGQETISDFNLHIELEQNWPDPRVPHYEFIERRNLSLSAGETFEIQFNCTIDLIGSRWYGEYTLDAAIWTMEEYEHIQRGIILYNYKPPLYRIQLFIFLLLWYVP